MGTHAKLSPSAYARWMNCPGSVSLIEHLTDNKLINPDSTSFPAEQGTAAHALGEKCLLDGTNSADHIGLNIYSDFKVDQDMAEAVQIYLDFIRGCISIADDDLQDTQLKVEVKCSLKPYGVPGLDGGTSDTVLIHEE